jgi:hypothetical protein
LILIHWMHDFVWNWRVWSIGNQQPRPTNKNI